VLLVDTTAMRLPAKEYFPGPTKKSAIVLHHTVGGSAQSTFDFWRTDPQHIGTHYLVERDGRVYQTFPIEGWAFHLGLKRAASAIENRSIGIEICSEGPLTLRAGKFYCFDRVSDRTAFYGKIHDCREEWRGRRYFAGYTKEATEAVIELVKKLLDEHGIRRQMPEDPKGFDEKKYVSLEGVLSHSHIRADKSDVHPGFDWSRLKAECGLISV